MKTQITRKLSRRQLMQVGLGAALGAVLYGCAPKAVAPTEAPKAEATATPVPAQATAAPAPKAAGKVVVFECCWNEAHIKAGKDLYNKFRADNPTIQVEDFWPLATTGWVEQLLAKTAADEQVDVIWWCASHFKFAEEGRLLDLKPLADNDPSFKLDDYQKTNGDFCFDKPNRSGAMWGIPTNYATNLLFYNTKLFDAAGVAYPKDWTWDDMLGAAKKLTKAGASGAPNEVFGFGSYGMDGWYWQHVLKSYGGDYVVVDGDGCLLNKPESVKALDFIQGMMYTENVMPKPADTAAMGITAMFASGKLAMVQGPEWVRFEVGPAHEKEGFEYGVSLLPKGPQGLVTSYWPGITSLTSKAKPVADAAWAVAKWITSDEYQRQMTVMLPESPAARISTSTYGFTDGLNYPKDRSAYLESPKYGYMFYQNLRYGKEMQDIIEPGLDQLWQGKKKATEVVDEITKTANDKIAELKAAAPKQ